MEFIKWVKLLVRDSRNFTGSGCCIGGWMEQFTLQIQRMTVVSFSDQQRWRASAYLCTYPGSSNNCGSAVITSGHDSWNCVCTETPSQVTDLLHQSPADQSLRCHQRFLLWQDWYPNWRRSGHVGRGASGRTEVSSSQLMAFHLVNRRKSFFVIVLRQYCLDNRLCIIL